MNDQERSELDWLKRRQARLEEELKLLSRQLGMIESRLSRPETPQKAPEPEPPPIETRYEEVQVAPEIIEQPVPPLIPPIILPEPVMAASSVPPPSPSPEPSFAFEGVEEIAPPPVPPLMAAEPASAPR